MSFEDQVISNMDNIALSLISRCDKIYKIIILRDVLNCFSSRFQAICDRDNKYLNKPIDKRFEKLVNLGGFFITNFSTLDLWKNHYDNSKSPNYITFNYNLFLCDDEYKKNIFMELEIPYNELLFKEKSTFGHGSSYNPTNNIDKSVNENIQDLFLRFYKGKYCNVKTEDGEYIKINKDYTCLLKFLINNKEYIDILKNDFKINIKKINIQDSVNNNLYVKYQISICNFEPITIDFSELNNLEYKNKYLKYKNKYIQLKKSLQ